MKHDGSRSAAEAASAAAASRDALLRAGTTHFLLNVAGVAVPTLVALLLLPWLAERLGTARLGALGLVWALVGYFGLFDLGMARAFTRRIAAAADERAELAALGAQAGRVARWLAAAVAGVAVFGAALLVASDAWATWLPPELGVDEARRIAWWTLACCPAVAATGVYRGVLEGRSRFATVNGLRIVFSAWSFVGPALVAALTTDLAVAVAAIAAGRWLGAWLHARAARRALPAVAPGATAAPWAGLAREGGWLTVSSVVGPVMVNLDRFIVAGAVSLAAVAWYTVPQEIVLRLLAIPLALASALFPVLARAQRLPDASTWRIQHHATVLLAVPLCTLLALAALPGMRLWMGDAFAQASAPAAALLAVGLFANCMAQTPFAQLQAHGRADVTGKLHLAELLPFLLVSWWAVQVAGIAGAAAAWSLRALVDAALLWWAARRAGLQAEAGSEMPALLLGLLACVVAAWATAGPATGRLGATLLAGLAAAAAIAYAARRLATLLGRRGDA